MRVGVIGTGNIGGHIAANLLADGHELAVHDVDAARTAALARKGARVAADAAGVGAHAEITFTSLPTPAVMHAVVDAWASAAAPGSVLVDLSTNAPAVVRAVGERVRAGGRHLLEAPLTGGVPGAQNRALVFMVGGEPEVFARVEPLLERLGRAVFHIGPLGLGNVAKLVNSLIAFTATWQSLEVLSVAAKMGVDLRTMIDVVRAGGAGNIFTNHLVEGMNQRERPTSFALELAAKDAGLLVDVAREAGVPVPVCAQVAQALVAAVGAGFGSRDFMDLVELAERQAGVRLHLPPARS
jgi:3-hydroxyisobutyrate dehydrogenase-like beta-hydroxyacid dehydrogenase